MKVPVAAWCVFALATALIYEVERTRQQATSLAQMRQSAAVERNAAQEQKDAIDALQQQKTALAAKLAHDEKALTALRQQSAPADAAPTPDAAPAASGTPDATATASDPKAGAGGMGKWFGQMLKDPAMKKALRTQQGVGLRMMYGDLVKQWALSPEEADTFYNELLDKQMGALTAGQATLQGNPSGADAASNPAPDYEARLKTSLGDDLYKQYQDYEKTVADRLVLNQFQQQNASVQGLALTPDQTSSMLSVMSEERQAQSANGGGAALSGSMMNGGVMDDKSIDAFAQSQADLNQRVDQRAATVLSAAQLGALKSYQTQLLDMQKASMQMAAKMMGGGKGGP